jgi:WD40 repeat protein
VEHAVAGAYDASISNDAHYSVISSIHHGLALWDLKQNALKYQWQHQAAEDNLVLASDISFDSKQAVTADRKNFALWNIFDGNNMGFWQVKDSTIRDIAVSNQGRYILYGKTNGVAVHVNIISGKRLEFLGHQEKINAVDLSPNGYFALTGGNDYTAYLWDTRSGQVIHRFNHPSRVTQVKLDPLGRYAFTADSKKQARIWDLLTGKVVSNLDYISRQKIFSAVRFSTDGKFLATGSPSRKLALWDVKTGKRVQQWQVNPRKDTRPKSAVVYDVAFSPDGKTLISESSSGLAETWNISNNLTIK